jgi:hypothetical protein
MRSCCRLFLDKEYQSWLDKVSGNHHALMQSTLEAMLQSSLGTTKILEGTTHTVKVAWVGTTGDGFTWGYHIERACDTCGTVLHLYVLTANAMFFLLRVLFAASRSFVSVTFEGDGMRIRCLDHITDTQVEEVQAALQMYRSRTPLSSEGIAKLVSNTLGGNKKVSNAAAKLHHGNVIWLLLHEIGHAVGPLKAPDGLAQNFIEHRAAGIEPGRAKRWREELSADFNASHVLMFAAQGFRMRTDPDLSSSLQYGKDVGFISGLLVLQIFQIYELHDSGARASRLERDARRAIEFHSHPPVSYRMDFLAGAAGGRHTLCGGLLEPWQTVLCMLRDQHAIRYPPPT